MIAALQRLRRLWYAPVLGVAMGLMLLRTLVVARLLDIDGFAAFSLGLLVSSTFCMLACLGLYPLLQREMPVQIVRGRERAGAVLVAQSLIVATACAAFFGLALVAGQPWATGPTAPLAVGLLHGLSQQYFLIATIESRSRGEPMRFARQNLARASAMLGAGAATAAIAAAPMAVLLVEAGVSFAMSGSVLSRVFVRERLSGVASLRIGWNRLARLPWRAAFALLALSIVVFLLANADRWLAAHWLDTRGFANYALAWTILLIAMSAQAVLNASVFAALSRRFATAGIDLAFDLAARVSLVGLAIGAASAWPIWWLLDLSIARALPAYSDARALIWPFIAAGALRLSDFWSGLIVIAGREVLLLTANVGAALVAVGAWWLGLWLLDRPIDAQSVAVLGLLLALFSYSVAALLALWLRRQQVDPTARRRA